MALEATHIRFALDLQEKYQVRDIKKYIAGSIYPDSRYVTKIGRELAHNDDVLKPEFATDDFRKGWQVHQFCDVIQDSVFRKNLPTINDQPPQKLGKEEWMELTATKIIQDMDDAQKFNVQKAIKQLSYIENPNGEDLNKIKEYHQIVIDLYANKIPSVEDYGSMWSRMGADNATCRQITERVIEIQKTHSLVGRINSCYSKMLKAYEHYRNKYEL